MSIHTFRQTAKSWNMWTKQPIKLIREWLTERQDEMDEPRLRSYYILLSYAFELMLKSALVAVSDTTEIQLQKTYGHDFGKILNKLKSLGKWQEIGIHSFLYDPKENLYIITTVDSKKFVVHDFTNIRYYPKQYKTSWDDQGVIYATTEIMLRISGDINVLWKDR